MRKVFLTILIGLMGLIPGHASNAISQEEMLSIPARPTYMLTYEPESSTLFFNVRPKGGGPLVVVLRNLTTGESFLCPIPSSHFATFNITEEAGIWRLDLWSDKRLGREIIYSCDFTIDNGMIVYLAG